MQKAVYKRDTEPNQALQQMIQREKGTKVDLPQMRRRISSKSWMRSSTFLLYSAA